jgi:hypothetical protein
MVDADKERQPPILGSLKREAARHHVRWDPVIKDVQLEFGIPNNIVEPIATVSDNQTYIMIANR